MPQIVINQVKGQPPKMIAHPSPGETEPPTPLDLALLFADCIKACVKTAEALGVEKKAPLPGSGIAIAHSMPQIPPGTPGFQKP